MTPIQFDNLARIAEQQTGVLCHCINRGRIDRPTVEDIPEKGDRLGQIGHADRRVVAVVKRGRAAACWGQHGGDAQRGNQQQQ